MTTVILDRVGRVCGVAFMLLFLADIFITPGEPDPDAGARSIAAYYAAHAGAVGFVATAHAVGGVFFLFFLASLVVRPQRVSGIRALTGLGGVIAGGTALLSYTAALAAAYLAGNGYGAEAVSTLATLRYAASSLSGIGMTVLLVGYALGSVRAWQRVFAVIVAALVLTGVIGTFATSAVVGLLGFAGSILFAVWVLVAALVPAPSTVREASVATVQEVSV